MNVMVIGPAGSGKSTFVKNFSEFLKEYDVKTVNLDPASDPIYNADADIRDFVRTEDIMREFKLGINGALLKSMDLTLNYIEKLIPEGDYVLFDTPGQMELFLYSKSGLEIVKRISDSGWTIAIFVVDSNIASTPENFISILAQNAVISLRLLVPTITVFNKCDIFDIDPRKLLKEVDRIEGVLSELIEKLSEFIDYTTVRYRIIKISAIKGTGFDDVLSAMNEVFCACGDIS